MHDLKTINYILLVIWITTPHRGILYLLLDSCSQRWNTDLSAVFV